MPRHHRARRGAVSVVLASLMLGVACSDGEEANERATIDVTSDASSCRLSTTTAASGNVVFRVTNRGSRVTEFYLLGSDGLRVVGEVENVGPGITRNMVVRVASGSYVTACKPGMAGDGIRAPFTVTDSGKESALAADLQALLDDATTQYRLYVRDQAAQLLTKTEAFAESVIKGDDAAARALYPEARLHWERIEPVAESFGDLDPKLDLREADLEPGQAWTGWHRLEKDLWPPAAGSARLTGEERATLARQLVADTEELVRRIETVELDATQLGNGAKELLDEVATGKVTGEEEIWSHTDLWDFQANVDGARIAFEVLKPALETKNKELSATLTDRFAALQGLLDQHRAGDGFVFYDELTPAQVQELASAVDALGEPLSQLTAEVIL